MPWKKNSIRIFMSRLSMNIRHDIIFFHFLHTIFVWLDTVLTASDGRPTYTHHSFSSSVASLAAPAGPWPLPTLVGVEFLQPPESLCHEDFTAASAVSLTPMKLVTQQENGSSQSLLFQVFLLFLFFYYVYITSFPVYLVVPQSLYILSFF